jgi:hypothetical protein
MTAAPVDRTAVSRLVCALEHAWTAIRSHHPEVPGGDPGRLRQ